jgi:hypothetical protein
MNVCISFQIAVDDYYLVILFEEDCGTSYGFINLFWENVDMHLTTTESC